MERLDLEAGTIIAERYRLERPIARGSMGEIWLARHLGLDAPCALKFLDFGVGDEAELRQRFEREARAAAQLKSPHVVAISDHGLHGTTPYIAMEYLEGEDLAARLERLGRLPRAEIARIVSHVARALTKAHAAGIVHRDLKPANVFLVRADDGEEEIAKVLDFGIAKRVAWDGGGDERTTRFGMLVGTPTYMSPEQARGAADVDQRSDLFSLAVIAFECIAGRSPFDREALADVLVAIVADPLPVPSEVSPFADAAFDAFWAKAAAREPADRFQSARELSDALAAALAVPSDEGAGRRALPESLGAVALDASAPPRVAEDHRSTPRGPSRRALVGVAMASATAGIVAAAAFFVARGPVRASASTAPAPRASVTADAASEEAPLAAPSPAAAQPRGLPTSSRPSPSPHPIAPRRALPPVARPSQREPSPMKPAPKPTSKPRAPAKPPPRSR